MQKLFKLEISEERLRKIQYAYDHINESYEAGVDRAPGNDPGSIIFETDAERIEFADHLVTIMEAIEDIKEVAAK